MGVAGGCAAVDLSQWLARWAARRAHVFIAELPGNWLVRAATQDLIADRGWLQAASPAEADVLAICGTAPEDFEPIIDRIWDQLPGPRVRVDIRDVASVSADLDRAATVLADSKSQRSEARDRHLSAQPGIEDDTRADQHHTGAAAPGPPTEPASHQHMGHGDEHVHGNDHHERSDPGGHEPAGNGADEHLGHDDTRQHGHHVAEHGGHHDMDHGEMDMAPAGIALAHGGEDRDGLEMDELHVRLGPFLAYWPAGLVMRCVLQGDVITAAEARVMGVAGNEDLQWRPVSWMDAARQTDHVVDLLMLSGWPRASAGARRLRQMLLADPLDERAAEKQVAGLARLVRRSRLLRWSLRDLAPVAVDEIHRYGLPAALAGDTYDRLLTRLDMVHGLIRHESDRPPLQVEWSAIEHTLPALIEGLDLATARLVIAGLGIDASPAGVSGHG